eukprot:scaffold5865_cov186-Amphora_coffeaeformis.AAC.9
MEAGSVTYHSTKLCRYGRCHKDRERIKALEKTKSHDHTDIDLYQTMKENERALIERRKVHEKHVAASGGQDNVIFDPIEADRRTMAQKETRQGDEQSGLDRGLAGLESLALGKGGDGMEFTDPLHSRTTSDDPFSPTRRGGDNDEDSEDIPLWRQQSTKDEQDYPNDETAIFLLERGYPRSSVDKVKQKNNNFQALQQLWNELGDYSAAPSDIDAEELQALRQEEREVLDAIFGEDIEWFMDPETPDSNPKNSTILDASVPITTYEPPARFFVGSEPPPELRLEIYLAHSQYPLGDPQLFTLISHVGEIWEAVVQEEGVAAAKAEKEARQARLEAMRQQQAEAAAEAAADLTTTASAVEAGLGPTIKYTSEQERRAYAASIVAKAKQGMAATNSSSSANEARKGKKFYNTGVGGIMSRMKLTHKYRFNIIMNKGDDDDDEEEEESAPESSSS